MLNQPKCILLQLQLSFPPKSLTGVTHMHGDKVQLKARKERLIHIKYLVAKDENKGINTQIVLTITDWTGDLHFNQQEISFCNQEAQLTLADFVVNDRSLLKNLSQILSPFLSTDITKRTVCRDQDNTASFIEKQNRWD